MPLKRLKNDHRVTTWRGVELWMAHEAGSLVFCRISHEALRDQAKRTHFEGTDVNVFQAYQNLFEQVASDAFDAAAINEAGCDQGSTRPTKSGCARPTESAGRRSGSSSFANPLWRSDSTSCKSHREATRISRGVI
jgi:uncharacterized protein with von Willebrand factor type A (vWA) domain